MTVSLKNIVDLTEPEEIAYDTIKTQEFEEERKKKAKALIGAFIKLQVLADQRTKKKLPYQRHLAIKPKEYPYRIATPTSAMIKQVHFCACSSPSVPLRKRFCDLYCMEALSIPMTCFYPKVSSFTVNMLTLAIVPLQIQFLDKEIKARLQPMRKMVTSLSKRLHSNSQPV